MASREVDQPGCSSMVPMPQSDRMRSWAMTEMAQRDAIPEMKRSFVMMAEGVLEL